MFVALTRGLMAVPVVAMLASAQQPLMPPVRGLTIDSAVRVLENRKLPRPRVEWVSSPEKPRIVVEQFPGERERVVRARGILLRVSTGPGQSPPEPTPAPRVDSVTVPSVIGDTRDELARRARRDTLRFSGAGTVPDDRYVERVARQDPEPGTRIPRSRAIRIWVGVAEPKPPTTPPVVIPPPPPLPPAPPTPPPIQPPVRPPPPPPVQPPTETRPPAPEVTPPPLTTDPPPSTQSQYVTVPPLQGKTRDEARALLDSAGLRLGTDHPLPRPGGNGLIALQAPLAGERVLRGSAVQVWISVAPPPPPPPESVSVVIENPIVESTSQVPEPRPQRLRVPNVVGLRRAAAESTLAARGLRAAVTLVEPQGTVDTVVAQEPAAGDSAAAGDSVSLRVTIVAAIIPVPPPPDGGESIPWLVILASVAGIGAAAATVAKSKQWRRDREWKDRLGFHERSPAAVPRLPATVTPHTGPELRLVPRPGVVRSRVVGDGPLFKGDER